MSRKPHTLTVQHPSGHVVEHTHENLRKAQMFLGMALLDNGYAKTKREAQALANLAPGSRLEVGGAIAWICLPSASIESASAIAQPLPGQTDALALIGESSSSEEAP